MSKGKCGKEREAPILKRYQSELKKILEGKEKGKPMFDKYMKKIDNHAFRREYAKSRYNEIIGTKWDAVDYRGYDKDALTVLSNDIGHNRVDVLIYNYLI